MEGCCLPCWRLDAEIGHCFCVWLARLSVTLGLGWLVCASFSPSDGDGDGDGGGSVVEVRRRDVVARSKGDVKFRQASYLEARGPGSGFVGELCCREVGGSNCSCWSILGGMELDRYG